MKVVLTRKELELLKAVFERCSNVEAFEMDEISVTPLTQRSNHFHLDQLCDYIVEHADSIAVRENINGEWGSYYLTELPVKLALKHAMQFIKEKRMPVRVVKEEGKEAKHE
jgi:hypothetical protein